MEHRDSGLRQAQGKQAARREKRERQSDAFSDLNESGEAG